MKLQKPMAPRLRHPPCSRDLLVTLALDLCGHRRTLGYSPYPGNQRARPGSPCSDPDLCLPPVSLPVAHPSASACCTLLPVSIPTLTLPKSFLPANLTVSCPHLCLMEKFSEQVPRPPHPSSGVCFLLASRPPCKLDLVWLSPPVFIGVPVVLPFTPSQLSLPVLLSNLLLSTHSVPDPHPEVRPLSQHKHCV